MKIKNLYLASLVVSSIFFTIFIRASLSGEEKKALPALPGMLKNQVKSSIKVADGIPRLFVDGKVVPISGFFIDKDFDNKQTIKYIDYAAKEGFTFVIISLWWHALDNEALKLDDFPKDAAERINWNKLDEIFNYAASKGVYLVPAFRYMCSPPYWWYLINKEQNKKTFTQTNGKGKNVWMPSFNVKKHEQYADQVITVMVNRYKNHPALLGWDLGFGWTTENNYPSDYGIEGWFDYSPFSKEQFRSWLKKIYGNDVASLKRLWGDNNVTFDNAEMPKPLADLKAVDNIGVNGAGDLRRQFYDWQLFRLEQKKISRHHFSKLYKTLDTEHILFANPFGGPLATGTLPDSAKALYIDYNDYAASNEIDIIFISPILTDNQQVMEMYSTYFYNFTDYMHARGKATFIAWENLGINKMETLNHIINLTAETGTGVVLAIGGVNSPDGEKEYNYSDEYIRKIASNLYLLKKPFKVQNKKIAFVDSPGLSLIDYQEMVYYDNEYKFAQYKGNDAYFTAKLFREAGLEYDVLHEDEIIEDPKILKNYAAVCIIELFRIKNKLKDALIEYRNQNGGLFIAGRSAVYDEYGNYNAMYLQQLLGISAPIEEYKFNASVFDIDSAWDFVKKNKSILTEGIEGKKGDNKSYYNILNIPIFDYKKEGYEVLGHLNIDSKIATVGYKGKTVFWFPRLGMQIYDKDREDLEVTINFLKNLYKFYLK